MECVNAYAIILTLLLAGIGTQAKAVTDAKVGLSRPILHGFQRRAAGQDFNLPICYLCDTNCLVQLYNSGLRWTNDDTSEFDAYFQDITNRLSEIMSKLSPDLTLTMKGAFQADPVNMAEFTSSTGFEALSEANDKFFHQIVSTGAGTFIDTLLTMGCGASFAMVSEDDEIFPTSGKAGVSYTYGICSAISYGTVQLFSFNHLQVDILAHELGHQFGLQHDGPVPDNYLTVQSQQLWPEETTAIFANCDDTSTLPRYIMNANPAGAIQDFTNCSKAYFNLFLTLSEDLPQMYDASCMTGDGKKRDLPVEEARGVPTIETPIFGTGAPEARGVPTVETPIFGTGAPEARNVPTIETPIFGTGAPEAREEVPSLPPVFGPPQPAP